ncbi:MAG: thiamine pyrophosphate-dependent dehydrogenase E1 component subunit alpha [Magnetovibrio sp.]|nr:thiamine pyrophosphate-dependent dehydrogenase E1 component subunit alpha [Magnetovibrio sp.]
MAEIYGKSAGCAGGKGGSMHLIDLEAGFLGSAPIVGSTIPIGVGAALSAQMRGEDRVVMVYLGDGAAETGVFSESLSFAALKNLPVVFVCENNLYSVYSPLDVRQPQGRSIAGLARAHGIESHSANGNDVEKVYELSRDAVATARGGAGPVFLELATYRWREHCGPNFDNHIGYRSKGEFEDWQLKDPVRLYRDRLIHEGVADKDELDGVEAALTASMDEAVAFAQSSPFPDPMQAALNLYAEDKA